MAGVLNFLPTAIHFSAPLLFFHNTLLPLTLLGPTFGLATHMLSTSALLSERIIMHPLLGRPPLSLSLTRSISEVINDDDGLDQSERVITVGHVAAFVTRACDTMAFSLLSPLLPIGHGPFSVLPFFFVKTGEGGGREDASITERDKGDVWWRGEGRGHQSSLCLRRSPLLVLIVFAK